MKILIITVAGMSTRFAESLGRTCLKCLYHTRDIRESLLYRMIHQPVVFDKYIIVGGYRFDELCQVIEKDFYDLRHKIILVHNKHYEEYGTGYSLYCGLRIALAMDFDEIVFGEGDLYVDPKTFEKVYSISKNVITSNQEPILAEKAVVFYYDMQNVIHYIYDSSHMALKIDKPFRAIYNSGQIWKFANPKRLRNVFNSLEDKEWYGTNLVFVEKYFQGLECKDYKIIQFKKWKNCNTILDYKSI